MSNTVEGISDLLGLIFRFFCTLTL